MKLVEIKNLFVEYYRRKKEIRPVRDVNIEILKGETVALVGESGCGKSTVGLSILNLIQSNEGRIAKGGIYFKDKNIFEMRNEELRGLRGGSISMVFQDPYTSFNPVLKVGEQIGEVLKLHSGMENGLNEKIIEILNLVRIREPERVMNSYPHQLSGGMLQRAMIGMAIAGNPDLLIADEPTTALDVTTQKEILELLSELKKGSGMSLLLITHNIGIIRKMADRIFVMYAGEIVEVNSKEDFFKEPLHPYTSGLLDSIPRMEKRGTGLRPIGGQVPDLLNLPDGCKFHPRCPRVMDVCRNVCPILKDIKNGKVSCHLYS